jgi:aminopeptidase N
MYSLVMAEGLKAILNSRMSKVGPVTKLAKEGKTDELAKAQELAFKIAQDNLIKLLAGEIKAKAKAAKSELPREVQTEARRIAREIVKNQIRAAGGKPSHYAARDITLAADEFIKADPSIVEKARENLANREGIKPALDIGSLIKESPTMVAKAKAKAESNKATGLSAKQAGMVPTRKKGQPAQHAVH